MGSSKKTKDRDKKKRKRERSTSRSRDHREKHHRHHHKHKKHKRHREQRSSSISLSDLSDFDSEYEARKAAQERESAKTSAPIVARHPPPLLPSPSPPPPPPPPPRRQRDSIHRAIHHSPSPPPRTSSPPAAKEHSKGDISLSVQETNKIRLKLGLKPLQLTSQVKEAQNEVEDESDYKAGEVIHKPAGNLRDKIEVEKLREKIAAQREKRKRKQRLHKTKPLTEDHEGDDAKSWVNKSRKMDKDRKEAEMRNKMLEELDAQFGVGDLVEEEITQTKKRLYDSVHLSGLKVQHDVERFSEGQTTILTLKDSSILTGEEDTLVNPNLEDAERVELNLKRKRAKPPGEVDYDPPEVDPKTGAVVHRTVLDKYDEEIEGERKTSFRIGRRGEGVVYEAPKIEGGPPRGNAIARLRQLTSLDTPAHQLATEYLAPGECAVTFRKVKKKKKRKRKMLTADDLEPLEDAAEHRSSRYFRMGGGGVIKVESDSEELGGSERTKSLRELMEEEEEEDGDGLTGEPMEGVKEAAEGREKEDSDDEGDNDAIELQEALARSRRAKLSSTQLRGAASSSEALAEAMAEVKRDAGRVRADAAEEDDDDDGTAAMTLNVTDEFCRSLGDIPTYGLSGNRAEDEAVLRPDSPPRSSGASWGDAHGGAWAEVRIEESRVEISGCERSAPILEEEPDTGRGIVNALRLAVKKGYLEKGSEKKPVNATLQHLRAVNYSIEDKTVEDDRRGRGGDRYMGPTMDFKEKDIYRPDVKLEYVDDEGRKLNSKEAFRYLSHKFHGKGSGKNKLEKRMKKWQEELLMKHMSSSDTPLQTLERQREKQRQLGAAYLVLSGSKTQETLDVKK